VGDAGEVPRRPDRLCAWLIRRCVDPDARFVFVCEGRCSFESILVGYEWTTLH
jgi:hypothetical protein